MATYEKPKALTDIPMHFCPGCTHGIAHRLVAETIDELGIQGKTIGVAPVGCAVFSYNYFNVDMQEAAHGRAPAVATGIKRTVPDGIVFTYQGDGDLASIGAGEIVSAASRGEKITVIFINNAIYGMTGGQMAPTSLLGQKTTTSPYGRDENIQGYPIKITEMLAQLDGVAFCGRTSLHNYANVLKTKQAIQKAFQAQVDGKGFSIVEILSTCPTNWGLSPQESLAYVENEMIPVYPLGILKEV
ncbi:thiamine pyrophosphate-dependent enzyme [Eubacteriales bacterium OttesenSCG-928-M02]|nr:thiamine pyrophosphate-dependent enzyme [Eubacteriales bacterium OttesenSCG-928-M02]